MSDSKGTAGEIVLTIHHRIDLLSIIRDTFHHGDNRSLHVHFIDFATSHDLPGTPILAEHEKITAVELKKDMKRISDFTNGVFFTWSGHKFSKPGGTDRSLLHKTFQKLFTADEDFPQKRSLVVALPTRENASPGQKHEPQPSASSQGSDAQVPEQTSEHTHYTLVPKSTVGGFTQDLWQTLITCMQERETTPVVCVLVNGGKESLQTALAAVRSGIPLIIMKGSGGFADHLADLYEKTTPVPTRKRILDKIKIISVRVPAATALDSMKQIQPRDAELTSDLMELCGCLHLLTVYCPNKEHKPFDSVILEALIKNGKEDQIAGLLKTMKLKKGDTNDPIERKGSLLVDKTIAMELFLDSLLLHSPTAVSAFLTHWGLNFFDFNLGNLLHLYSKEVRFVNCKMEPGEKLPGHYRRFKLSRRALEKHVKRVSTDFPLGCSGDKCKLCTHDASDDNPVTDAYNAKDDHRQTCLHPVQELFLWSLLSGNMELAAAFWEHCDDKVTTALFARAVCRGIARKQDKTDAKRELKENARRFEELAVQTLKAAERLNEDKSRDLLVKPCPWWGGVTAMEVAWMTKSKRFIGQDSYQQQLNLCWAGKNKTEENQDDSPFRMRLKNFLSWLCKPQHRYVLSWLYQIAFLGLFGYTLLFDLSPSSKPVYDVKQHPCRVAVAVWVLDTAVEETRQALTANSPVARKQRTGRTRAKLKTYISQYWNKLDVSSILLFIVGFILLVVPNDVAFLVGRGILALDYIVFMLRFLQMFVIFKELGVFLVIAGKMVTESWWFMGIVLTIMAGYAVACEVILYPELSFSVERFFSLPSRSYWQSFGELGLETFQKENCNSTIEDCPSVGAQYVVSFIVGVYMVVNHVLLFNLLIAKFSSTFEAVRQKAGQHQAWQYCQLVREFRTRSPLPPPCNVLYNCLRVARTAVAVSPCASALRWLWTRRPGRCREGSPSAAERAADAAIPLLDLSTMKLDVEESCGRCVTVQITRAGACSVEVEVKNTNDVFIAKHSFKLGALTRRLFLWKDDPWCRMHVTVSGGRPSEERADDTQKEKFHANWELHNFEHVQAKYALRLTGTNDG